MGNDRVNNGISESINKTAIKNFAVYSRNKLIKDIKNKAAMIGITESGIQEPHSSSTGNIQLFDIGTQDPYRIKGEAIEQRNALIRELKSREKDSTYETAYETLIEEVAYTWFNRIIAIRFMEANNYLPDRMRVLSSGIEGINEPEFITHAMENSFEFGLEEKNRIIELKSNGSNLAMDELFQFLFIKQCNTLNTNLPELFEKTNDYTELLLTVSYNDVEGVIYKLVHDVPEAYFDVNSEKGNGQVEIIGWLYQYYNSERKDEVINIKGKKAVKKEDIPAATQLFTTDWVVRYMVDNSLGKYWVERNSDSDVIDSLEYLVSKDIKKVDERISPEDIKFLDNCMGSGHILVYAFDLLMKIYESEGYTSREAAKLIVEKNLYGLEIDKRSYQLSYFAIMMKARQYNRKILNEQVHNNVSVFFDATVIDQDHLQFLGENLSDDKRNVAIRQLKYLIELFKNAQELGSIIMVEESLNIQLLYEFIEDFDVNRQISFETIGIEETQQQLKALIKIASVLQNKYEVVVTNPPYMNKFDKDLKKYVTDKYKKYSGDLFSVFIYRNAEMIKENGYAAYMSPFVWMFIKTYEELRKYIIEKKTITSLIQMEYSAFEEATVPICTFIIQNNTLNKYGNYIKLSEFKGGMEVQRQRTLEAINNYDCPFHYISNQDNLKKIPGSPIAYWASDKVYEAYENFLQLGDYAEIVSGMTTGNNDKYMRDWKEINISKIYFNASDLSACDLNKKYWFPYNKGGSFRRWYGNNDWVVNWSKSSEFNRAKTTMTHLYLKPCITWSDITSAVFSARACGNGFFFDVKGSCAFPEEKMYYPLIAFLNSKIAMTYIKMLNPTITTQVGDLKRIPFNEDIVNPRVVELTKECIRIAKEDYDNQETSWDFQKHPLINSKYNLREIFNEYKEKVVRQFYLLKKQEEELNEYIIKIYDMGDYLDSEIADKYISVNIPNEKGIIQSFISYAVGCIFGRYSLDNPGIVFAGGVFDLSEYSLYSPTKDNIILITEDEHSSDDIVNRFVQFVRICFGAERLEDNLSFIAEALEIKGSSTREIIREYFLKSFYKEHTKTYQKRPIYWLYDSGKQNGFKALVYMHRYDEDTTGKIRVNYLHQTQRAYERAISNLQEDIANSKDAKEMTQLQTRIEKLTKQLKECKEYDERLGHIALDRIPIDLDDGVKVNYQKVQTDSKGKVHQILAEIK